MIPIAFRFRDALWSIRREFGMETDIDRIISFIVFDRKFNEDMFITYPKRVPEDFRSALLARIRDIVRQYYAYRLTKKGYHRVLKGIYFLENVVRYGFKGCLLIEDKAGSFRLALRPEHLKKGKK